MRAPVPARLLLTALACLALAACGGGSGVLTVLAGVRTNLANLKASAGGQWGPQVAEMDGAVGAFQTTVSGVDGDSLLSSLPTVVKDLERIDAAWTSLEGQIDRDCG